MPKLTRTAAAATALALLASVGCSSGPSYDQRRPGVDQLVAENDGVQAKDVVTATDMMANSLLSLPELNAADHQWTVVLKPNVDNKTADAAQSYGVFVRRLRSRIAQLGHGRVQLIENLQQQKQMQNEELEHPADNFGQGGGGGPSAGMNPDYDLYITIDELPNRATSYFTVTGALTNLRTRQIVWNSPAYEFQAAR